ncbi:MAG: hypothetical protein V3T33_09430 [Myxococcota bacterium]
MARRSRKPDSAAERLDELQSLGDRLAEWIGANPVLVLGSALGILILAGGYGLFASTRESAATSASEALSQAHAEFREAMGARSDELGIPEPANPATALRARNDFVERFQEVAQAHTGTAAGALAWLQVGALQEALGDSDAAIATWESALAEVDADSIPSALILVRIAAAHEDAVRWLEAGEAYERAADVESYPLRYTALADAARCFADAGEEEKALAAFERVESEASDYRISDHIRSRLNELRARRQSS